MDLLNGVEPIALGDDEQRRAVGGEDARAILFEVDGVARFGHAADRDESQRHLGGVENIEQHHLDALAAVDDGHGDLAAPFGKEGVVVGRLDGDSVDGLIFDTLLA